MAMTVNSHEAKAHLSQLLERVSTGEEIILAKAGKPMARLVPLMTPSTQRLPGSAEGQIWIAPDFDAPLPEDMLSAFEGQ
ncbi:MAG: type II toxin-antitoxin system Phd/YefM family antitoxin [Candidatus Tectimicrobiota bacterium]